MKTTKFPIVRDGILVGVSTNREMAHFIGEKESRGCTQASGWAHYPFLRMPNVHLEPGPANSPTPEQIIADMKDGVMIDGSGSYSIDQQRYNGQFGGGVFWEIKNGKNTRAVTDVTYNAITTDFWGNLDAITGREYGSSSVPAATPRASRRRARASRTARRGCESRRSWWGRRFNSE